MATNENINTVNLDVLYVPRPNINFTTVSVEVMVRIFPLDNRKRRPVYVVG